MPVISSELVGLTFITCPLSVAEVRPLFIVLPFKLRTISEPDFISILPSAKPVPVPKLPLVAVQLAPRVMYTFFFPLMLALIACVQPAAISAVVPLIT